MIEREGSELALTAQTGLLGLNRSSLYYQPLPPSPEEIAVKHRIDELYTAHPFYGSRRITAVLKREMVINRKAVQRHMREMGIAGICPGPNLSKRDKEHHLYPYLLRHVQAAYANHVWGIEIVCTQMTKTDVFAGRAGRDHVTDFHVTIGDDHAINQQEHQFALVLKGGLRQALLDALAEGFNGRHQARHLSLPVELGEQGALLLG